MANVITYSSDITITRATRAGRGELIAFIEPSTGVKEASFTTQIAPGATATVALGDITVGKYLLINGKVEGGVDDINGVAHLTNVAASGVAAGAQDVRFGSFILIADANFSALSISNLDSLNAFTVEVLVLGN